MKPLQLIFSRNTWQSHRLLGVVVLFITLLGNFAFFRHASAVYYPKDVPFLLALGVILLALNYILLGL